MTTDVLITITREEIARRLAAGEGLLMIGRWARTTVEAAVLAEVIAVHRGNMAAVARTVGLSYKAVLYKSQALTAAPGPLAQAAAHGGGPAAAPAPASPSPGWSAPAQLGQQAALCTTCPLHQTYVYDRLALEEVVAETDGCQGECDGWCRQVAADALKRGRDLGASPTEHPAPSSAILQGERARRTAVPVAITTVVESGRGDAGADGPGDLAVDDRPAADGAARRARGRSVERQPERLGHGPAPAPRAPRQSSGDGARQPAAKPRPLICVRCQATVTAREPRVITSAGSHHRSCYEQAFIRAHRRKPRVEATAGSSTVFTGADL